MKNLEYQMSNNFFTFRTFRGKLRGNRSLFEMEFG